METRNSKPEVPNSNIYLTGFMGSGKSTVGPLVARRLGAHFADLDDVIAGRVGQPVPVIFEKEGEACFRECEAEALRAVSEANGQAVIATGGGTLVREENLRRALQSGSVVYLRAPARVLAERLRDTAAERPLLQSGDRGRPLAGAALTRRIEALLAERRPFYERAHATVDTVDASPKETVRAVVNALRIST